MERSRYNLLMHGPEETAVLTPEEIEEGWHFCYDWDFLLIHKDDDEAKGCSCQ